MTKAKCAPGAAPRAARKRTPRNWRAIFLEALAATSNGTGVDVSSAEGMGFVSVDVNIVGGTSPTVDLKLQSSPDNSTWTDVTGAAITQVAGTGTSLQKIPVDLTAWPKYMRAVLTVGGTSPDIAAEAALVYQKKIQ